MVRFESFLSPLIYNEADLNGEGVSRIGVQHQSGYDKKSQFDSLCAEKSESTSSAFSDSSSSCDDLGAPETILRCLETAKAIF